MSLSPHFSQLLHTYFNDWLVGQRNIARHTILSYRDTWRLFLRFVSHQERCRVVDITFDQLTAEAVLAFLQHLEEERQVSILTRNCRLAALRSFFTFVADREPVALVQVPIKGGWKSCGFGHRVFTLRHHFRHGFGGPPKRMGLLIPFGHKRHQTFRKVFLVRKIGDLQPLTLQDREPLLNLVHPGAMHGWKVEHKTWMFGQPSLHLFALMHPKIIEHHMDRRDSRSSLPIHMFQKRDKFHLPFPLGRRGVDLPCPRIKSGKEVQSPLAGILVFNPDGLARLGGQGWRFACPGLQTGFLVDAQHHFPHPQGARIEGDNFVHLGRKGRIPWDVGRQPQMMAPGFQLVVRQNPLDRLWGDGLHNAIVDQLPRQFCAIPLR